jgi:hypothetical protein
VAGSDRAGSSHLDAVVGEALFGERDPHLGREEPERTE